MVLQKNPTYKELLSLVSDLRSELDEANDTIEAIRTGQVDALIVKGSNGHQLYTLKSADHTYRLFIEKMNEGAVTLNNDGIILYSNSKFGQLVNSPLAKIVGTPFEQFIAMGYKHQFALLMERGWKEDCKGEVVLKTKKYPVVRLSLATLELEDGIALSVIVTDLTDLKESQRHLKNKNEELEKINNALEASNNDLLQFASVASHDLQEPLRKIEVFSNILKDREGHRISEDSSLYLSKILSSAGRMKQLIIDILNYSRLSANNNNFEQVNLLDIVSEWMTDYEIFLKEKQAEIEIGKLPYIEANKGQLRQVFQNILSNALKFTRNGQHPVIKIKSARVSSCEFDADINENGSYYRVSVKDNGIGFNQKYLTSVFSLFERLNTKDKYEGTGIGLAVAKKIIEKHNGIITAKSEEHVGSEFIFIIPAKQSEKLEQS